MYHIVIVGSINESVPIALKLLAKEHSLSITIIRPENLKHDGYEKEHIPKQVAIIEERSSKIFMKGNCMQLENGDYLYYDLLIVEPGSVEYLNFSSDKNS